MSYTPLQSNVVVNNVAEYVRQYLVAEGVGYDYDEDTDWAVAIGAAPEKPIDVITIYYEGSARYERFVSGNIYEHPQVRIDVRAGKYTEGLKRISMVTDTMDKLSDYSANKTFTWNSQQIIESVEFHSAVRNRGWFILGRDDNGYWLFNIEFMLVLKSLTFTEV